MRQPTFCLYKCENEVADQMRGTCNCAADQRLLLSYRDNTSVSDPEGSCFSQRGSYSIIMISNPFKRDYQLAASVWGMGKLGLVKAIHRLKCNHAGCFYFQFYEYYAFLSFI